MTREEFVKKWKYSPECGDGWLHLADAALRTVSAEDAHFEIRQIKEKFGGLRVYLTSEAFLYPMLDLLERISMKTCEECGNPGELRQKNGWVRTRCTKHDS